MIALRVALRGRIVDHVLRHESLLDQLRLALDEAIGLLEQRGEARDLGAVGARLDLEILGVDLGQQLALLHLFPGKAEHADHLAGDFGAELGIESLHGTGRVPDAVHPVRRASTSIGTMPPSFRAPPVLAIIALAPSPWMS